VKPLVALFATVFFVLIGTSMDLSVLNPFDPANREGLIVAVFLLMVIGTTFLAPVLLRLVIPSEPSLGEEQAAKQPA
jgi:Kef-type K+ transport system membrane component KefB